MSEKNDNIKSYHHHRNLSDVYEWKDSPPSAPLTQFVKHSTEQRNMNHSPGSDQIAGIKRTSTEMVNYVILIIS